MPSVHPCLILLNSSWQNSWFNPCFPGLHCAYCTLPYTARLSRRPRFSKQHILLFPKKKQMFHTWAAFTPLLPNSSSTFSSWEALVIPQFGRAQTFLTLFTKPFCLPFAFTLLLQLSMHFFRSLTEEAGAAIPYCLLSGPSGLSACAAGLEETGVPQPRALGPVPLARWRFPPASTT